MVRKLAVLVFGLAFVSSPVFAQIAHPGGDDILPLDSDLTRLKEDFNAAKGSVRLVFIIGPTCGICLRGMADLDAALLADMQGDGRLRTFAVHVPVMGATRAHAEDAMGLMSGPNIYHYWDGSGNIGRHYTDLLGINIYAWDIWFAYGPDAEWTGVLPPAPAFWRHQLPPLPDELYLDAEDFAKHTMSMVGELGARAAPAVAGETAPGEADVDYVFQTPERPARTYIDLALGGRENIESVASYTLEGRLERGDRTVPLMVTGSRPDNIERAASALPPDLAKKLAAVFDFEGFLVDWRGKDFELATRGVVKLESGLAWRLEMTKPSGERWIYLVDSHTGNTVRQRLLAPGGDGHVLEVRYSDFRKTGGISFPHRVEYRGGDGRLIAAEVFDQVTLHRRGE